MLHVPHFHDKIMLFYSKPSSGCISPVKQSQSKIKKMHTKKEICLKDRHFHTNNLVLT